MDIHQIKLYKIQKQERYFLEDAKYQYFLRKNGIAMIVRMIFHDFHNFHYLQSFIVQLF